MHLRLTSALAFPFSRPTRDGLLLIAMAACLLELIRAAVSAMPSPVQFVILAPITLVLWIMLFRLASEVLMTAAMGGSFRYGFRNLSAPDGLALRHIGLWLLASLGFAISPVILGVFGSVLTVLLLVLVMPTMTLQLTLRNDLFDALNPIAGSRLVRALGATDYGRLCGLLAALATGYLAVGMMTESMAWPTPMQHIVALMYWGWAMLAWFFLAGTTLYHHREDFELAPADQSEAPPVLPAFSRDPDRLWQEIQRQGGTESMHAALADALDRSDHHDRRIAHGRLHVAALMSAFDRPEQAVQRTAELIVAEPLFVLEPPSVMVELLQHAAVYEHSGLVYSLALSYLHHYPRSKRVNDVRLLACEALQVEHGERRDQAQRWFQSLMTEAMTPAQQVRLSALAPAYLARAEDP
ncbi:MAG: hypothetical protein AAGH65_03605 [Pseudomonadota bacterium]